MTEWLLLNSWCCCCRLWSGDSSSSSGVVVVTKVSIKWWISTWLLVGFQQGYFAGQLFIVPCPEDTIFLRTIFTDFGTFTYIFVLLSPCDWVTFLLHAWRSKFSRYSKRYSYFIAVCYTIHIPSFPSSILNHILETFLISPLEVNTFHLHVTFFPTSIKIWSPNSDFDKIWFRNSVVEITEMRIQSCCCIYTVRNRGRGSCQNDKGTQ